MSHGFHSIPKGIRDIGSVALPIAAGFAVPGLGSALGLGTLGTAALGAGVGGATAAATHSNPLLGAVTGGAGAYFGGGGSLGGILGNSEGNATNTALGSLGKSFGPATSTSVLNAGGNSALGGFGSVLGSAGGGGSSYGSLLSPLASTALGSYSNSKATDQLVAGQKQALGLYNGIANEQWTPGDLASSPGYQFQLDQGQKAIDQKNAATGGYYSGGALKDATEYSQGLASTTAQQQYQQWLSTQAQKLSALGQQAGLTEGIGASRATGTLNQGQLLGQGTAGAIGALSGKYYNPTTGTFYNPNANGIDLASLLKQRQGGIL